jgi:hypothetical protein
MSLSDSLPAVSYDVLQKQDKLNIKLGGTLNKDTQLILLLEVGYDSSLFTSLFRWIAEFELL